MNADPPTYYIPDPQDIWPVAYCTVCGGEIYDESNEDSLCDMCRKEKEE